MKPSEVLRKAAQIAERDHIGARSAVCIAAGAWPIRCICGDITHPAIAYLRLMTPENAEAFWWPSDSGARIIGLCLAADIAESEGQ